MNCVRAFQFSSFRFSNPPSSPTNTQTLDPILNLLSDGEWHNLNEISTKKPLLKLSMEKLVAALNFLAEYEFIELSPDPTHILEAKITPPTQEFLHKIKWIERSKLVSKP